VVMCSVCPAGGRKFLSLEVSGIWNDEVNSPEVSKKRGMA